MNAACAAKDENLRCKKKTKAHSASNLPVTKYAACLFQNIHASYLLHEAMHPS